MAFSIQTNVNAMVAQENLRVNSSFQTRTIQRITSGYRINQAGDDTAGLAVANGYRSDLAELTQGIRNANDGVSQLQIIDGGMANITQLLDRARTLATQSASESFTDDRTALNDEFQKVLSEINRQAQATGMTAGGDFAKSMKVFIGGGRTDSSSTSKLTNGSVTVDLSASKLDTASLGLSSNGVSGVDVRASSGKLAAAITAAANDASFKLTGSGFSAVTVDYSTGFNASNIKDESDLVDHINNAIATAEASNSNLAASNIRASIDSATGKLTFTSAKAFSVVDGGGGTGASNVLLGASTPLNAAVSSVTVANGSVADITAGNEALRFSYRNSTGALVTHSVNLANAAVGAADPEGDIAGLINADANLQADGIFAAKNSSGDLVIMKADGGAFEMAADLDSTPGVGGVTVGTYGSSTTALGNSSSVDITTATKATSAITALETALKNLSKVQGIVGSAQNQLAYATNLAQSQLTNLSAAESRIRDADIAAEAANLTKAQVLQQASMAAMAQANSAPQAVLALLRG